MSQSLNAADVTDKLYQPNVENNQQDTSNQNENGEPEEQLASVQEMTQKLEKKRKNIPFWIDNPNVLFHNKYITEFFPVEGMTYEQKLNAITRTIILLSIIGLIMNQSLRTLIISLITFYGCLWWRSKHYSSGHYYYNHPN